MNEEEEGEERNRRVSEKGKEITKGWEQRKKQVYKCEEKIRKKQKRKNN